MKAAAVVINESDAEGIKDHGRLTERIRSTLRHCRVSNVDIVVFPALLGCLYGDGDRFLEDIMKLSLEYEGMVICPGSYYEKAYDGIYHSSCLIADGSIILRQRQLYLAKWEKEKGLSRGTSLGYAVVKGLKTALIISTDLFYPQVSRAAAMSGAELVLAPAAIKGGRNLARQLSGLWQNVQQNLFFAVESCFKGSYEDNEFYGRSIIHGPLEMTSGDDGFLAFEKEDGGSNIITAELDNYKRKLAVEKFNTLAQMNIEFYRNAPFFGQRRQDK